MQHLNIELKARTTRQTEIRAWLEAQGADFRGADFQTDTYFHVPNGRLKLRTGNVENNLIHYRRADQPEARASEVALAPVADGPALKNALARALGILVEVHKRREIYFMDNVKIHLDELDGLGRFVEIEAIAQKPEHTREWLLEQCRQYAALFRIQPDDILAESYSDLLLRKAHNDKP
ncbi:MAG TPA: class IV adenylate cyclase [Saprospiraceae bacterium]|nr:class IV adenylate cyclase [Saprospiraceae bacterium]HNL38242.1 class IV adenylate cyclase [Saprospiraceae bacterium]HNM24623.1 class IV adenylate cyclase [Saprospiraceae bacterium]